MLLSLTSVVLVAGVGAYRLVSWQPDQQMKRRGCLGSLLVLECAMCQVLLVSSSAGVTGHDRPSLH
jgi:hypothetical protein